jgi:tRNA dimethylallyltransferase
LARPVIALFGPTAVGKTEIAIELADLLAARGEHAVAISADAFQVYEGLDVLSAKPSAPERERLEHRLISIVPLEEEFSVAQFAERAHAEIDGVLDAGQRPIVVGGTGLYLRAALTDLDLKPAPEPGLRERLEREVAELGLQALHAQLPTEVGNAVHPNDRKRIIRALELERMGERAWETSDQLWSESLRRPTALFGVVVEREQLGERIARRVERMLTAGAVEEVETALERGVSRTAAKAIGFAEISAHLRGDATLAEVGERIARRHRQYAKRQLTWMRKLPAVELIDRTDLEARAAATSVLDRLAGRVSLQK